MRYWAKRVPPEKWPTYRRNSFVQRPTRLIVSISIIILHRAISTHNSSRSMLVSHRSRFLMGKNQYRAADLFIDQGPAPENMLAVHEHLFRGTCRSLLAPLDRPNCGLMSQPFNRVRLKYEELFALPQLWDAHECILGRTWFPYRTRSS